MMKKITPKSDVELQSICAALLNRQHDPQAYKLSLLEFKRLYAMVASTLDTVPITSIVNLGKEAIIQFSSLSPQRYLVTDSKELSEEVFDFVLKKEWRGPKEQIQTFGKFVKDEIRSNRTIIVVTFLLSSFLLAFVSDRATYDTLSGLLLQSSTIFLSIYLIFTVTQNPTMQSNETLFKRGNLQRFLAADRNLTTLAILTIGLTLFITMLAHFGTIASIVLPIGPFDFGGRMWLAVLYAIAITLLIDTFTAVVGYYLERTRAVLEQELVDKVLHEDYQRHGYVGKDQSNSPESRK